MIDVWREGKQLLCSYRGITVCSTPTTRLHYPSSQLPPCVHLMSSMPSAMLFGRKWVEELNFQLRLETKSKPHILARRQFDVVTLAVNHAGGDPADHTPECGPIPREFQWHYAMHEMRWADLEDPCADNLWLGLWVD